MTAVAHKISYSIEEAVEATGYSKDVIQRAMRAGDLVPRYVNSKPVLLADDLRSWIENAPTESPKERANRETA